jgi:RNA polymerase sigma-70 factor (ECF subfamily)
MWPEERATLEWLDEARRGRTEAVGRLLSAYRAAIHRMVEMRLDRRLRSRLDVSDVVQEVLLEVSRRLREYLNNPGLSFRLWVRRIALDRVIDAHRRHRQAGRRSMDREEIAAQPKASDSSRQEPLALLVDPQLTPAAAAVQRELVQRVEATIDQLEPPDIEILLLRHYERLTNQEAAAVLGLSEPAAAMRYLRALRRLRDRLCQSATLHRSCS